MSELKTESFVKTRYISAKIVFLGKENEKIPSIKINHQIETNGICNIENISKYWKYGSYRNNKFKLKSNRIQFLLNSNDFSVRLLHPYCPIWSCNDHISFYEESEENDLVKTAYQNNGKKIWTPHAGYTCELDKKGDVFLYPNKVKLIYKIKEKPNESFTNSIKEELEEQKAEKKSDDTISEHSSTNKTEIVEKDQELNTSMSIISNREKELNTSKSSMSIISEL